MEDYESRRHELYSDLERVLGERSAGTLMTSLPPNEWADLATKADLDAGLASVRKDMAAEFKLVRTEMAQQGAELRAEIAQQGAELRGEIARQGTELRGEIARQGTEARTEIAQQGVELRGEIGELRTEVGELRTDVSELRVEMIGLRTKVDTGFELLTADFGRLSNQVAAEVYKALFDFSLRMYLGLAGLMISIMAAGVALAHFLRS